MAKVARFPMHKIVREPSETSTEGLLKEQLDFYEDQFHKMIEDYPELADLYWKVQDLCGKWIEAFERSD